MCAGRYKLKSVLSGTIKIIEGMITINTRNYLIIMGGIISVYYSADTIFIKVLNTAKSRVFHKT